MERTEASKCFEEALHWEVVAMLERAFAANHYWSERSYDFVGVDPLYITSGHLQGVLDVSWTDGLQVGTLYLLDVDDRVD